MADLLPVNFPIPAAPAIASYDGLDFVSKLGYKTFYAIGMADNSGAIYTLSSEAIPATSDFLKVTTSGSTTVDFDAEFKSTAYIKGLAIVSSALGFGASSSASITVEFIHVDSGNNETLLVTVTSDGVSGGGGASGTKKVTVPAEIPRTRFARDEKLRISITITKGGSNDAILYIDPSGATSSETDTGRTITVSTEIRVPFEIR